MVSILNIDRVVGESGQTSGRHLHGDFGQGHQDIDFGNSIDVQVPHMLMGTELFDHHGAEGLVSQGNGLLMDHQLLAEVGHFGCHVADHLGSLG